MESLWQVIDWRFYLIITLRWLIPIDVYGMWVLKGMRHKLLEYEFQKIFVEILHFTLAISRCNIASGA